MPEFSFDIVKESDQWSDEKTLARLARKIAGVLEGHARGHVSYVFSDDSLVHVLNRAWRGQDKPTNVLSFPDGDADETGLVHLGDVIVAFETLTREADALAIPFEDHLVHLLLHGSLHLLGYDHMTGDEAKAMESLEIKLLAALGIKDPYNLAEGPLD